MADDNKYVLTIDDTAKAKEETESKKSTLYTGDYADLGGGYIIFGTYPQSKKAVNVNIGEIYDKERGYYIGSDNCLYAKCDGEYYKVEPIKWKVLSRGSEYFIISDMILDAQWFDYDSYIYANSGMRNWLYNDFYNKAFNDSQQNKIVTTNVDNSALSTGDSTNQHTCINTSDKVFLLSRKEAQQYFSSNESRKCVPTEYAVARGAGHHASNYSQNMLNGKSCGWWWLRSPYPDFSSYAQGVGNDGSFDWNLVCDSYGGVRCALKFKP